MNPYRQSLMRLLILSAAALLGLGLVAPAMTITTDFGRWDGWIRLLDPDASDQRETTYSLLSGILHLLRSGDLLIGIVLLAFTVCFPTLKLALMAGANEVGTRGRVGWLLKHAGKWSMLDVLVIALLVLAIKALPGGSELSLRWGLWCFATSVGLSLLTLVPERTVATSSR
jgi:paraquat-inducible protein A